mgnify:CR=1 FL=1
MTQCPLKTYIENLTELPKITMELKSLLSFLSISQVESLESNGSIEWLEYQEVFWIHNITNILVMRNINQEDQQ